MNAVQQRQHYQEVRQRLNRVPAPPIVKKEEPILVVEVIKQEKPAAFLEIDDDLKAALKWPPKDAINAVLEGTGVTLEDLKKDSRKKIYVRMRQQIFWILRTQFGWSMPKIGKFFNKDHTTILHGVEKWQEILNSNGALK